MKLIECAPNQLDFWWLTSADQLRRVVWSNEPHSYSLEVGCDIPALGQERSPPDSGPVREQALGISPFHPPAERTPCFCSSSCGRSKGVLM